DAGSAPAGASAEPSASAGPSATAEPSPSPTVAPSARPPARPGELIAGIRAGLDQLAATGQLDRDAAERLDERLAEVADALAAGEIRKVRMQLRKAARTLVDLREDGKLTPAGFEALGAALNQVASALPAR
ncbi:FIMAH domain-containing protein, partial [Couchioplanes caeruleus subsp. azureus]